MTELITITTATGTIDNARSIAEALVSGGLAACVHILPAESWYRWKGDLHQDAEHVLQIKTSSARAAAAESCIKRLHSYELPEITVMAISGGSDTYLTWVREQVTQVD